MGKINNYLKDTDVTANDKWVGSDFENFGRTKNFTPNSIAKYLNENNVINTGSDLRYRYQTLNPGEARAVGSLSFETERGASIQFSTISTFLLSKQTLKQNDVSDYLEFLDGGSIILSSAENQNIFAFYNVTSISRYVPNDNFLSVVVEYVNGNGSIIEDLDYIISLVIDKYSNQVQPQVNADWNSTSGASQILNKPTIPSISGLATTTYVDAQDALKVDKVAGKGLSENDYTTTEKNKLSGIAIGAEVNVNADWNAVSGDAQILNKPTIPNVSTLVPYTGATTDVNLGTKDIYLEKVFLNDSVNGGYASIHYADSDFHIEDADGHKLLVIEDGFVQLHKTDTIQSNLFTTGLTVTRDHYLPNASGTIALTSDIPAAVTVDAIPTDGSSNAVSSNGVFDALATKQNILPALTNGSVLFSNGTTIAQDNANLFWDDTNNRLGIGTNAPTVPLDVNGRVFISTGTEGAFIAPLVVKNTISYQSPFTQFIQIWQNNINQNILTLRTDGSLTLAGSNSTYNSSFFLSNNNGNGTSLLTFARGNNGFWFPSGNSLGINANGAEKLRVLSTGEVTIGATTAGARLDVRAQGALSTDIAFRVRNSADTADLMSLNGIGTATIFNDLNLVTDGAALRIKGIRVVNYSGSAVVIGAQFADANIYFTGGTTPIVKATVLVNGNFLIGTTTDAASAILNVNSTTKGFLPPRMTNAQRLAIASPAIALMVYCTDTVEGLYINKSTGWQFIV